jgi:uncharacterized membrane protein
MADAGAPSHAHSQAGKRVSRVRSIVLINLERMALKRFAYSTRSYIRFSLWFVPLIAIVLYLVMSRVVHAVGRWIHASGLMDMTTGLFGFHMLGARTMLETIITMTLSFLVFTFGSLLIAIQVAGGQYTPRIIATALLRDNVIRNTAGLFIFTFLFALRTLDRMDEVVHQLSVGIAAIFGLACLVAFLYLIDYAARMLRPISLLRRVAEDGFKVIEGVYPSRYDGSAGPPDSERKVQRSARKRSFLWFGRRSSVEPDIMFPHRPLGDPARTVLHERKGGTVLAVDRDHLIAEARRANGVIELVPHVGDFVAMGEPLFRLYGGAAEIEDKWLRAAIALGAERTLEQDPMFAFRILVDIAVKALSRAINDPTTAVLAIDQINRLLRSVGQRHLREEQISDSEGNVRLVFPTPNWEDYVHVAFREIRQYGTESLQVARRLRAMGESLIRTLPERRHAAVRQELMLLDRMLQRVWRDPEDLALARMPDSQGLGSGSRM